MEQTEPVNLVSQQKIAQILEVNPRTIRRWHDYPEAPEERKDGLYDVEKWKRFAAVHGRKSTSERKKELEAEKLEIANQRQRFKHECETHEWTPNRVVDPALAQFSAVLVNALEDLFERRLARHCAHKSADELRQWGRVEFDALMDRVRRGCSLISERFPAPKSEAAEGVTA